MHDGLLIGYEQPRFRTTTWPEGALPVPAVLVCPLKVTSQANLISLGSNLDQRAIKIPDEMYLRELMDLDIRDLDAFIRFQERYGRFCCCFDDEDDIRVPSIERRPMSSRKLPSSWGSSIPVSPYFTPLIYALFASEDQGQWHFGQRLVDVWVYAIALRDAVRVWLFSQRRLTFEDLRASWEGTRTPNDATEAMNHLEEILCAGLRPFSPKVRFSRADEEVDSAWADMFPSLFGALCIQLFNQIIDTTSVSRCQNESCRRFFVRQRGRADFGQNWTKNVKYCSATCARAQSARQLRRSKTKVLRLRQDGLSPEQIAAGVGKDLATVERWLALPKRSRK